VIERLAALTNYSSNSGKLKIIDFPWADRIGSGEGTSGKQALIKVLNETNRRDEACSDIPHAEIL
jgi:hypothetical protein